MHDQTMNVVQSEESLKRIRKRMVRCKVEDNLTSYIRSSYVAASGFCQENFDHKMGYSSCLLYIIFSLYILYLLILI